MNDKQIIFFDGVCNLCNSFVDFVVARDQQALFQFAPLQGQTAKVKLPSGKVRDLNSVVLVSQGQILEKSDAALSILPQLGGLWGACKVFWLLPKFLRDLVYDLVAANRYRLFGKRETCRLPTTDEKARFLD